MTENFQDNILTVTGLSKSFPGVRALNKVRLNIRKGEIHALVGENGAGKSTLIKCLTGIYRRDEGEFFFDGKKVDIADFDEARSLGIAVIHQELTIVPHMTVAENIFLGRFPLRKQRFIVDDEKMKEDAAKLLRRFDLDFVRPDQRVKNLSVGQQQMVEICRALALNARFLIMDEPTASLANKETEILLKIMRSLREKDVSILFVSHKLEEIYQVCDRITVFRDGEYIGTRNTSELPYNDLITMMVGRSIAEVYPIKKTKPGDVFFEANHIRAAAVRDVSFNLRKGEILGFYGLVGAGRSETMRALLGIDKNYKESVLLDHQNISLASPVDAIRHGIVLAPEDRKKEGLILKQTVDFNITITILKKIIEGIRFRKTYNDQVVSDICQRLRVKTPSFQEKTRLLSGGNQQKVVLAKWLVTNPRILILDEPTRGIDIGAKHEIYNLMFDIVRNGVSIIFITSEMGEVLNLSDRVNVMREGRLIGTLEKDEINNENIMQMAIGGIENDPTDRKFAKK